MTQKWYQKPSIQGVIVGGLFVLLAAVLTPFVSHWLSRPGEGIQNVSEQLGNPKVISPPDTASSTSTGTNLSLLAKITLYPDSILKEIDKVPPLQRPSVVEGYKGLTVQWQTSFIDAVPFGKRDSIHLMLLGQGSHPWIYCDVSIKDYPELKVMKESTRIIVIGKIAEIAFGKISLRDVSLRY